MTAEIVRLNVRRNIQTQNQTPYQRVTALIVDFDDQLDNIIRQMRAENSYAAEVLTQASIDCRYHLIQAAEAICHGE